MDEIFFETSIKDFGDQRVTAQFKYYPVTGACQMRKRYSKHVSAFAMKRYWTDWRWLTMTHERKHYLSQPNVKKEIEK